MLTNFTSKVANKNKVQLFFRSKKEADKAKWHHYGTDKLPKRSFFGYLGGNRSLMGPRGGGSIFFRHPGWFEVGSTSVRHLWGGCGTL